MFSEKGKLINTILPYDWYCLITTTCFISIYWDYSIIHEYFKRCYSREVSLCGSFSHIGHKFNQGWIVFLTLHEMIRMRYLFRFVFGFCKAHGKVITKYVYMLKQRFYRFHFAYSRDNEKETKMMYIPYFLGLGILFCSVIIINFLL